MRDAGLDIGPRDRCLILGEAEKRYVKSIDQRVYARGQEKARDVAARGVGEECVVQVARRRVEGVDQIRERWRG